MPFWSDVLLIKSETIFGNRGVSFYNCEFTDKCGYIQVIASWGLKFAGYDGVVTLGVTKKVPSPELQLPFQCQFHLLRLGSGVG